MRGFKGVLGELFHQSYFLKAALERNKKKQLKHFNVL